MLDKRDLKIVTNAICSSVYSTQKQIQAWHRIKKFLEVAQKTPTNSASNKIADAIESTCFPREGLFVHPRKEDLAKWVRQLRA